MEGPELGGGNWGTEQGAGAGKHSEGGHSRGARAGGGGSELEAAGVQSWRRVVRPRADLIRDHCGGHSSVVPVWVSSLPTCFLPGSYNLSELSFPS